MVSGMISSPVAALITIGDGDFSVSRGPCQDRVSQ